MVPRWMRKSSKNGYRILKKSEGQTHKRILGI